VFGEPLFKDCRRFSDRLASDVERAHVAKVDATVHGHEMLSGHGIGVDSGDE
jgi:hypothetical protein